MSADRPRRTLRQSTKLIPTPTQASTPNPYSKRISYSGKKAAAAPPPPPEPETPKTGRKTPGRKPATGGRRGRKPTVTKRPECFNNKPSKYHNDYHYGSDFDEDSEEPRDSEDEQESLQAESEANESIMDETLDSFNPDDIEDINSSLSNLPIWLNNDIQVEQLIIPGSSEDLVLNDKNLIFPLVGIYETVTKFYKSLRITPFKFEDFCACLSSTESSVLLVELHVQLLKSILREDEAMNITYGPLEYKDSIQAAFYFTDHITWVDGLLTYFKTDKTLLKYTELVKGNNYPFCSIDIRVKILNVLLNIYLSTNAAREALMFDDLSHEDHCRICGRLGELICCETCTSVAHLGCINPPIIDPPDEWKCATCTKHLIPGLSDCFREEDKTSLRHEKLGFDRHGRSYWFLVRRILVESEDGKTAWYFSTPNQLIELMDSFSSTYESALIENINYHKQEILSQMGVTEKLTNQSNTQHRKSYLDYENGQLAQLQKSRELIEKQNELEELKIQEEILLKKQVEEAEKLRLEEEVKLKGELEKKRIREERLERRNKRKYGDDFEDYDEFHDMDFEIGRNENSESPERTDELEGKEKMNSSENMDGDKNDSSHTEENLPESEEKEKIESPKPVEDTIEKSPQPENSIEKNEEKETPMELDPPENIVEVEVKSEQVIDSPSSKSTNNAPENSLKPPIEIESPLRPILTQIEKEIEILKAELMDNDKERMTRLKSIGLYKLGQENNYKSYVNYYTTDSTALSKLQHNDERDKKRYMSHKFSLTQVSEFKWIGKQLEQYITFQNLCSTIKSTILAFENNIPVTLMHTNWGLLRKPWIQTVNSCKSLHDFKLVIGMFRGCLRDCLFNTIWVEGVGHLKLVKMNPLERDDLKKMEKKMKKFKDDEDDRFKVTQPFVKYTIPCKHQLWKQKGEEYRLHGQFGWIWMRNARSVQSTANYKYNLLNGPYKYVIQVKSDNNKIKTMLIDPTVYNKLMAKRNLNMGSKPSSSDVKPEVKIESEIKADKTEDTTATPTTTPAVNTTTSTETIKVESPSTGTVTTEESDSDVVNSVMQNILSQLEGEVEEIKKPPMPIPQPQPPKKFNTELINVSLGIVSANRILYPKIAHRINLLDDLLSHRLKLNQMEESQLLQKFSTEYPFVKNMNNYKCYSYDCANGKSCYSPICKLTKMDRKETSSKVSLKKLKPENTKKNIVYPLISPYVINKKPNIFVLQSTELMKLARTGGREITPTGFNSNNKTNTLWNYPCGRPSFYKIWEFNLLNSFNLASIGMAIRILYSCIRWDDLQMKLPNSADGGKNQVTTDMEHITSEILQHRILGPFLNKVQYLKRKEIVPIDLPKTVREITPSRLGLRKRKRTELQDKTEPTVVEEWVNENQVEIWEIRFYGDKIERPKLELMKKNDSPNTRIRSGVILKQPDKFTHQTEPSVERVKVVKQYDANVNNNNVVEPIEPVQRTVHLSKRDNHVKINTVNKVQIPTASQQLQQQRVVEQQEKSTIVKVVQQQQPVLSTVPTNMIPSRQQPIQRQVVTVQQQQQPLQQIVAQQQPQSIAEVALQQIQEKQHLQNKTSPKKFFVTKTKEITPKPAVNRKPKIQVQVQQQTPVVANPVVQQQVITQSDQRLQIVRGYDGKLQLRGLMPGQHAYQTADGKIHVITSTISSGGLVKVEQPPQQQQQGGIVTNQQVTVGNQQPQQQIVMTTTSPGGNKQQQIVMAAGTPASPQQIIMATTPGGKQQQIVMTTPGNKQQIVMAGGKPQFVMATTPGGNKQQFVMTSTPGNPPQFVMTTTPGNKQQIVMATTPLNKPQQQAVVTPPQQPLINISSSAMKTVISNSGFQGGQFLQQQGNSRIQSPNIIKSKQTPPLLANKIQGNQFQIQGSQIFFNQAPIILSNQQQQQPTLISNSNQANKIIYTDGTKTYMINSGGMSELQIKALTNQFQQKKFIIKTSQEQNPVPTTTATGAATASGQLLAGNVQQIVSGSPTTTPTATTQQIITTPSGQLIMMSTSPKVVGTSQQQQQQQQQIVTSSPVRIAQQPITAQGQQQQQVVMVSGSPSQPGVTTTPVRFTTQQIMTNVGGQPTVVVSGGQQPQFVQQIVTTPGRIRPQILSTTPGTMGRQIISGDQIGVRMAVAGQQVLRPYVGAMASQQMIRGQNPPNQIITTTATPGGQILTTTTAMKPSTLPISIVSPSKSKLHHRNYSATSQIGSNPPFVTMTMARQTSPTKSPIVVSPTRPLPTTIVANSATAASPTVTTTPNVTMIPTVAMTPAERPMLLTTRPLLTMASPKLNIMKPTTPTSMTPSGNMTYQKIIPVSTSQISTVSNQQMTSQSQLTQSPGNNQPTPNANNLNSTVSVQAQMIETPDGSKIILPPGNKFSPDELLRIQTQLKKQFLIETDKSNVPIPVTLPMVQTHPPTSHSHPQTPAINVSNDSSLSSIEESINLVIQNTHNIQNKSPKKKVKNINKDKLTETLPTPSTIMGNSTPTQPEPIEPTIKTNKKLLKLQQTNQKTKLLAILTKYKELLKKDIEKKRNTMENELKVAIQKEITQERIIAQNAAAAAQSHSQSQPSSRGVKRKSTSHAGTKPKKKKTKSKTSDFDVTKKYCICNTPYDETKFYVGCEKCSNWFHGDCIGITQSMADCLSDYICDLCQTTPAEKTYCLCKKPYDESQFYICCDKCQDWFHGRCIGVIQSESTKMDEYVCPSCDPTTELNSANLKILNPDDFILMQKLTKQLMLHKSSWAFAKPVDVKDAPNYYKVIKEPMDLQTVDLRVSEKVYSRLRDFIGDVTKIFDNCRYYNAENSEFYKLANALELFFKEKVILLRKKLI